MATKDMPRIYNQNMELIAILDKATAVGYRQAFNDLWTAHFTLPSDDTKNEYCQPFNYIEIYDEGRRIELFRIMENTLTRENGQGLINYECEHVITTLLDNVLFRYHQIGNIGVFTREVLEYILSFQTEKRWVLGKCDFSHQFLYKWESEKLLPAVWSVAEPFLDTWHFTYDTRTYPWKINLVRAEEEIGAEIRYRKNMQGIQRNIDPTSLVNRIYPLGAGEGDNQLTIESVNNGIDFVEDKESIEKYGLKETIWADLRFENPYNMLSTSLQMLEHLKMPYISYSVSSIDLFKITKDSFDEFK